MLNADLKQQLKQLLELMEERWNSLPALVQMINLRNSKNY